MLWSLCQGEGRGFESRRPLHAYLQISGLSGPLICVWESRDFELGPRWGRWPSSASFSRLSGEVDQGAYPSFVTSAHTVDASGRYDGLTLRQALPLVVQEIVNAFNPVEVIVFGSVARGDDGPDSDLDLLVVLDQAKPSDRRMLVRQVRQAITTFVPVDIVIGDVAEVAANRDSVGSAVYWPLREGTSMYRRTVNRVG